MKAAISRSVTPVITSPGLRTTRRKLHAAARRIRGRQPTVHYFHQADDPYSHLAAQTLEALAERYRIELRCHLVPAPGDSAAPERARLEAWSRRDAQNLAGRLGLDWPGEAAGLSSALAPEATNRANAALAAAVGRPDFPEIAVRVGAALWRGAMDGLVVPDALDAVTVERTLRAGADLRAARGHYLGATFYFEGEWYWGVDRLHYLEARLRDAGLAHGPERDFVAPVKDVELTARPTAAVTPQLHFFFSFRSPYVCISVPRVRRLAAHYGADLRLRFILPMVMRGLPVPRAKSRYIVLDAKREAERVEAPFGCIVDPVGRATERGIAVLNHAMRDGRGPDFVESFLRGVWAEGIDATTDSGLNRIAARADIDARAVAAALKDDSWREAAEANRLELFEMGLWGAPTLRVDDGPGHWGQDRLWVIERDLISATSTERC